MNLKGTVNPKPLEVEHRHLAHQVGDVVLFSPILIVFGQHQSHVPAEERPATFTIMVLFFFERTTQDSARFIDIAEKYKATALEGHNQEKKKKTENRTHPVGLGYQPRKLNNSTHPVGLGHQYRNSSTSLCFLCPQKKTIRTS